MQHHENTLEALIKAFPSLTNSINIIDSLLHGYTLKDLLKDSSAFGITLSEKSLITTVSRLRRFTK